MNSLDDLEKWVHTAGFFCPSVEPMDGWNRLVICTERGKTGFGGKSLWVAVLDESWYVGTWAGMLYRIRDKGRLIVFLEVILSDASAYVTVIDQRLCNQFELDLVPTDEFDSILKTFKKDP